MLFLHDFKEAIEVSVVVVSCKRLLMLIFKVLRGKGHSRDLDFLELFLCFPKSFLVMETLNSGMRKFHQHIVEHDLFHHVIGRDLQILNLLLTIAFD